MSFVNIYQKELRTNRSWLIGWLLGINAYSLIMLFTYPGKEGMQNLLKLLDDESFAAFFGNLDLTSPGFSLWIAIMSPFLSLIIFIASIMTGIQITLRSVSDGTGELVYTLPVDRFNLIVYRTITGLTITTILLLSWLIPLGIPFTDEYIELSILFTVAWWGFLFTFVGLIIGIVLGGIVGSTERGLQFGLLVVLLLYIIQILANFQPDIKPVNEINPLTWFTPEFIFVGQSVDEVSILKSILFIFFGGILGIYFYIKKDLVKDLGVTLPFSIRRKPKAQSTKKTFRSGRSSIFSRWARPLEKKYPFTADYIYSDHRTLLVVFVAIIMIWPLQLMLYPGEALVRETIQGFGNSGLIRLVIYNHDLTNDPWLWYVMSQAIGTHFFIYLPLVYAWINKAVNREGLTARGEIFGAEAIDLRVVIHQRILAMILELIWAVTISIGFLAISEFWVGETNDFLWETIATLPILLLYYSLILFGVICGLQWREKGIKFARAVILISFLLFVVGIINTNFNQWYILGIWGLYDPVLIIQKQSIFANNFGILILFIIAILLTVIVTRLSHKFSLLIIKVSETKNNSNIQFGDKAF